MPRVAGALIAHVAERRLRTQAARDDAEPLLADGDGSPEGCAPLDRADHSTTVLIVASGFVLGDGIVSIVTAGLKSGGVASWTCIGCPPAFCQGCP
jgi:uncharacterized oligopeptide transporter (OPT) family protein